MHPRSTSCAALCGALLAAFSSPVSFAGMKPAAIFTDHMVLQQGQPAPVWGTAAPGERITVAFAGQEESATADTNGAWRVTLKPLKASAVGRTMLIRSSADSPPSSISHVVVGEVWLASGQSNMAMAMDSQRRGPVLNAAAEIAAANWPALRLFQVPVEAEKSPAANGWKPCTPETVKLFSAVAYFYGRELHAALQVPVGVISAALGGSAIAPWTPPGGGLYQAHVKPLCPYGMRGVIWYQGESDPRLSYSNDMRTLVTRLRDAWGIGDFPFYYVQIAPAYDFTPNSLPLLWQAQVAALDIPNVYMAPTSDLGVDVHPKDKRTVGGRLARLALALTYKTARDEYSGPVFRSAKIEGGGIRLSFDHAEGLRSSDEGPLTWFTVAGEDRVFHFARAAIDGACVVVSSDRVPAPVAARFAWDKLAVHNLVNGAGLPAFPFRSDDWPVATDELKPFHAEIAVPRGAAAADLEAARPLLDKATVHVVQRGGREYAQVAWAVAGDAALMRARVLDARVGPSLPDWKGAAVDWYASLPGTNRVRQVVFELQGPGRDATATGYEMGSPVAGAVPGSWRVAADKDGGYTIEAAVPLSFFGIPGNATAFLVDMSVNAAPFRGQNPQYLWLFSPQFAFSHNEFFAKAVARE